jgi:hypothetical protein
MANGAIFIRVDDASLFLVFAFVIIAASAIAYLDSFRARRKQDNEREHPRRAA